MSRPKGQVPPKGRKMDLESALGDSTSFREDEIQDLSEDAQLSYHALLKQRAGPRSSVESSSSSGAASAPSQKKAKPAVDDEARLPEYPSTSSLDEKDLQAAITRTNQAFSKGEGWIKAVEEGVKLELARAKSAFTGSVAGQVYLKMIGICEQLLKNADNIIDAASREPPRLLPNPKNKELQSRYDALRSLSEKYEQELSSWETVESTIVPRPTYTTREIDSEFAHEADDEELAGRLHHQAKAPQEMVKGADAFLRRLQRVQRDIEDAEKETAALVTSYEKTAFEEDARNPRMLIHTLATSALSTIGEDTNGSDF